MKIKKIDMMRTTGIALLIVAAFAIGMALVGCAPKGEPGKTPQQVWIDAHPTTVNGDGECIEFDDEPCDDDPYDLDDWYESFHGTKAPLKKPTPRPMLTANQPKPSVKTVPAKTPGPVKTTKRW